MRRGKILLAVAAGVIVAAIAGGIAFAQPPRQVPPPYAGVKNPFPWDDTSVQKAGKQVYQRACLCHGPDGGSLSGADFSSPDFPATLENDQDFYFWVVSEGETNIGMPGFKSSLSDQERWQVLTYMWSLGKKAPSTTPPSSAPPPSGATLYLTAPAQDVAGQSLTFTAVLQDRGGSAIDGATVQFFVKVDFFTTGLMALGEAVTDGQGIAVFNYTPHLSGDIEVVARYQDVETASPLALAAPAAPFYQAQAEVKLPTVGKDVFIGPPSALELGEMGNAPVGGFRLPGGYLSWLWLLVIMVALLWATYFRVIYQVYRMPAVNRIGAANTRVLPAIVLIMITVAGLVIIAMLFHSPYTHFHFLR